MTEKPHLRVIALVNNGAGTVRAKGGESLRNELHSLFSERGVTADVKLVTGDELKGTAEAALKSVRDREADAIVVGGGDGTIRTLAGVLADSDVPMGVLPLGTLNHFAKDVGLPVDLPSAVDVIARRVIHNVDVAEVNGEVFINNSSIGIYPYMVLDRDRQQQETGRSKWPAMCLAAVRGLRRFPRRRLTICVEGHADPYRTPCLFVGNNEYGRELGTVGKRERLDGAELCLFVAQAKGPAALLGLAVRSLFGRLDEARDLEMIKVEAAEIRSRASRMLVALDGEVEPLRTPLRYRTRPGALSVFSPAKSDSAKPAISEAA